MVEIVRGRLGTKPAVRIVADVEVPGASGQCLLVTTTNPGIVAQIATHCGAEIVELTTGWIIDEPPADVFVDENTEPQTGRDEYNPPQGNLEDQEDVPVAEPEDWGVDTVSTTDETVDETEEPPTVSEEDTDEEPDSYWVGGSSSDEEK
jgi:hypothetical protein